LIKKLNLKNRVNNAFNTKFGFLNKQKYSLENKNYSITYTVKGKSLVIDFFKANKEPNLVEFKKIYLELLSVAKTKKLKKIYTLSWVLSETKGLSDRLGFKLVKGSDKKFNLIKSNYPDYKITGLEQRFFGGPDFYGIKVCLIFKNKSSKKEVAIPIDKNSLPMYIKEL